MQQGPLRTLPIAPESKHFKRKVCITEKKKKYVDICSPQQIEVLSLFCLSFQTDCRAHLLLGFYQQWSSVHDYGGKALQ